MLRDLFKDGLITEQALVLAEGYYSGQTSPDHCYRTYGGVSHKDYNSLIRETFDNEGYTRRRPMNADQMLDFITERIRKSGNERITSFLTEVESERQKFLTRPGAARPPELLTKDDLLKRGRNFRSSQGYVAARLAGTFAALGSYAISEGVGAAEVCATSPHFRRALAELSRGDMDRGLAELYGSYRTGSHEGVYDDLLGRGLSLAAFNFVRRLDKLVERLQEERRANSRGESGE